MLKYLFEAEFFDGLVYTQTPDDTSVKFPPVIDENGNPQGKSSFSDIQDDVYAHKIKRFTLYKRLVFGRLPVASVDLTDGSFMVNGMRVEVEGARPLPVEGSKFELVYFRVRRQTLTTKYKTKTGEEVSSVAGELPIKFMIGWTTTISNITYTQKILVQ